MTKMLLAAAVAPTGWWPTQRRKRPGRGGSGRVWAWSRSLERLGIAHEQMMAAAEAKRYPQIGFKGDEVGFWCRVALMARLEFKCWLKKWCGTDWNYRVATVAPPSGRGG